MKSIRKTLSSGIFFTALAKYSNIFLSILIGAILARLLSPEEFGIVAIVTVFVTFFSLLSDFGLGPAVVQNRNLSNEDIKSIFSFSILLGVLLASLFFGAAPFIANFYEEPKLINISRLLSLAILFHSLQIIPKALNRKQMRFKQIGIISVSVQMVSGVFAITLAFYGFSYNALVLKSIFDGLVTFIAFYWLSPIKITLRLKMSSIRKIARFSFFQFMFSFINYFSRNADNLLIGKYFSSAALGYYDKSYRLMMMPVANLTHVFTPVLLPVFSNYQSNQKAVYKAYQEVVKLLALIGFPLSVFLFFTAPEIINILYGIKWAQSIPVFKLLALTVGIQIVLSSTGSIFQAVNRTDLLFYSGFLSAIFMVSGIAYGVFIGKSLESIGYGLIIAFTINFFQGFYFLIKRALLSSYFKFLRIFYVPIFISTSILITQKLFSFISIENIVYSFFLKFTIALATYVVVFIIFKSNRELLKKILKK